MEHLITSEIVRHGLLAVFALMILESACVPVPSEVVMLFGGALAGGLAVGGVTVDVNVVAVALAGALGNVVGASIAYLVGRLGGRPFIERWGRYLLVRPTSVDRAEAFFERRGDLAVLVGRVLPVVRTFISLPAGVAKVPPVRFAVLTFVGSLPWTFALALSGQALVAHWSGVASAFVPVSIGVVVLGVGVLGWRTVRRLRDGNHLRVEAERTGPRSDQGELRAERDELRPEREGLRPERVG